MDPVIYLGHGASGDAASMTAHVEGLRRRGIEAHALSLPRRRAEDAVPALLARVPDRPGVVVGGHSFGGRVASLAAAGGERTFAGLVCLSYPLHRPGAPDGDARVAHWPAIACPVLLLSGEADPFARIDLLRATAPRLADGRLVTWPRLGHTLRPVLEEALDLVAAFVGEVGRTTAGRRGAHEPQGLVDRASSIADPAGGRSGELDHPVADLVATRRPDDRLLADRPAEERPADR